MKHQVSIFFGAIFFMLIALSCNQPTGSDTYDSVWSPSGDSKNFPWSAPAAVEFSQVDGGFQFSPTFDTTKGGKTYIFVPKIYQVTNMETAEYATISFKARIVTPPDSVGNVLHQFGVIEGTIETSGDSVNFSSKLFVPDVENTFTFSTNPDSCSKLMRFKITTKWDSLLTDGTVITSPVSKKITVEVTNIVMKVYGISVLK
ncbi:MAG: hypothetical protein WCT99_06080 [Bacteroidota bacterium]|jgi:hypothetical protein